MAHPDTVPPKSDRNLADVPALPVPPASGQPRVDWWDALEAALQIDLLQVRLGLRADGLSAAAVEDEMLHGYRPRLLAWAGAICDAFAAELIWLASA